MKKEYMEKRLVDFCKSHDIEMLYCRYRDTYMLRSRGVFNSFPKINYYPSLSALYASVFIANDYNYYDEWLVVS